MQVDTKVDRRKVLSTATAAAGVAGLTSTAAAADDSQLTTAEVARSMADAEVLAVDRPTGDVAVDDVRFTSDRIPDDGDIHVGKYKSASVPGDSGVKAQSYQEWLRQDAPTGFEDQARANLSNLLYFQQDIGAISVAGYTFNFGVGLGLTVSSAGGRNLSGTLSVDVYINGASFALASFSAGYTSKEGLCVSVPAQYRPPGVDAEGCIDFTITNEDGEICLGAGISFSVCAGGDCPAIDCSYCKSISSPTLEGCADNPF
jgi:hypothetical protein